MRYALVVLSMLFGFATSAIAQVSISINLQSYPELVPVPGYPVYYSPRLRSNYFFYDGMYWIYQGDAWYESDWYNGPWQWVGPEFVPLFVLRIPVRYYRDPPVYFRGWRPDAPPRWGQHWGNGWQQHRRGWDQWDRHSAPSRAPLPVYQRQYAGNRYPRAEQQQALRAQNYRYQPRDALVRQHYQQPATQSTRAPAQPGSQGFAQNRNPRQQDIPRPPSAPAAAPHIAPRAPVAQPPEQRGNAEQRTPALSPPGSQGFAQNRNPRQQDIQRPPSTPAVAPHMTPQAPVAQPPEQRGNAEQRNRREPRGAQAQAAPPAQAVPQPGPRMRPGPAPEAQRAEPRAPAAAPPPPPRAEPAPRAEQHGRAPPPPAVDKQKGDPENRKQER
ncbi:hypothetical protein [Undibacterium sp.]|jgi:hypothetical protein|uniref:hypothetical protein n=1 Tax=Undibacterium sp. TaxID=1914977 RepID=UPI002BBF5A2E|nr:hypothetical protein [Undibacterium sp.]HTD04570.1 hypothetical protein [Undibacterium sp.]